MHNIFNSDSNHSSWSWNQGWSLDTIGKDSFDRRKANVTSNMINIWEYLQGSKVYRRFLHPSERLKSNTARPSRTSWAEESSDGEASGSNIWDHNCGCCYWLSYWNHLFPILIFRPQDIFWWEKGPTGLRIFDLLMILMVWVRYFLRSLECW